MSRMLAVMVLLVWPAALVYAQQSPPESESDAPPRATHPPIVHTPAVNSALDLSEIDDPVETPAPQPVSSPVESAPEPTGEVDAPSGDPMPASLVQGPPLLADHAEASEPEEAVSAVSADRPTTEIPRRAVGTGAVGKPERKAESRAAAPWYRNPLLGLGVVLVVIFGAVKLLRKYVPATRPIAPSVMRVVGRMALSSKQSVVLVHVGRRMVLVGVAGDRMVTLSEIDDAEEVCLLLGKLGERGSRSVEFDSRLAEQFGRYEVDHVELPEDERAVDDVDEENLLRDARGDLQQLMTRLRSLQAT